jgi:tRNA pseudouridine38-40 synthase
MPRLGAPSGSCAALRLLLPRPLPFCRPSARHAATSRSSARADARPRTPLSAERAAALAALVPDDVPHVAIPEGYAKRSLALHVGYLGGSFRGNSANATLPRGDTVDDVLEDALFRAGHVLRTNYRSPGLARLGWSRSSRTDKGVSSVATFVSCRLEADAADWEADAAGGALVARVNAQLPPHVRCFAALPVPRSFCARRSCAQRAYHYLLPLRALTLPAPRVEDGRITTPLPPPCGADDPLAVQRLAALDEALRSFEGTHPFHNFTKRRLYAPPPGAKASSAGGAHLSAGPEEGEADDDSDDTDDSTGNNTAWTPPPGVVGTFEAGGTYWLPAPPEGGDRVGPAHYRTVLRCRAAAAPEALTLPGGGVGEPFVRISVEGESCAYPSLYGPRLRFLTIAYAVMLHQIRKMVATAVAVARGTLPAAFIPAALAKPCRAKTPMAPAPALVLAGATFHPFRPDTSKGPSPEALAAAAAAAAAGGEASPPVPEPRLLVSPPHVATAVEAWSQEQLLPSLAPALASPEWEEFLRNLQDMCPPPADVDAVLAASAEWQARPQRSPEQREMRREQRREFRKGGGGMR